MRKSYYRFNPPLKCNGLECGRGLYFDPRGCVLIDSFAYDGIEEATFKKNLEKDKTIKGSAWTATPTKNKK